MVSSDFAHGIVVILFPSVSLAEITKIVIEKREPFAGGHEFAGTGAYEKLVGKAYGEIDPGNPSTRSSSTSIRRQRTHRVASNTTLTSTSCDPSKSPKGTARYFSIVTNRGRKLLLPRLNDAPDGAPAANDPDHIEDVGNGWVSAGLHPGMERLGSGRATD